MKIYFVRHGESELNAKEIHQTEEATLSAKGKSQAEFVAKRFTSIPIDKIYSSHYPRALETAKIINILLKKEIVEEPLLRELKRPSEVEGKQIHDKNIEHIKEAIVKNAHDSNWHYSDEENVYDLMKRSESFIEKLRTAEEDNILVISHGIAIRMTIACMMYPCDNVISNFEYFLKFMHMTNTGITVCERLEDKSFRLLTWNDYAHVEQL